MITRHGRRLQAVSRLYASIRTVFAHVKSVSETGDDTRDDELRVATRRRLQDGPDDHDASPKGDRLSTTESITEPQV